MNSNPQYKWRVKSSEHGMSLENFIYKQMGDWSHKQVKVAIDHKRAFVNGRNVFISKWNVKKNDLVLFAPSNSDSPDASAVGSRYKFVDVLIEDPYVIVTNKPAFIDYDTYVATVQNYLKRQIIGKSFPYLGQVHRLDKETRGVMLFTKKKIANTVADQFRHHTVRKYYVALVEGRLESDNGVIRKAILKGRFDEGRKVRIAEDEADAKTAQTHYHVMERYDAATLVRLEIKTGRTHQIRIHMSDLGYPVVGDKIYGRADGIAFRRQALHAERLEFYHPVTNKKMKLTAPMPADMKDLIDKLRMTSRG